MSCGECGVVCGVVRLMSGVWSVRILYIRRRRRRYVVAEAMDYGLNSAVRDTRERNGHLRSKCVGKRMVEG